MKKIQTTILTENDLKILDKALEVLDGMYYLSGTDNDYQVIYEDCDEDSFLQRLSQFERAIEKAYVGVNRKHIDEDGEPYYDLDEPACYCKYCGSSIYKDDDQWIAADGAICCCDECVVDYNRENFPEDDDYDE